MTLGFNFTPTPTFNGVTTGAITANGSGFSSAHGMPLFQYFDTNGTLIAQTTATSVAANGSSASGPVPSNIGSVPAGIYLGRVSNANASGAYDLLGTGTLEVVSGKPGTGTVTMSGHEQSRVLCLAPQPATPSPQITCPTIYDFGTVSITVNGFTKSVAYDRYSTNFTIATGLASAFNADSASPVTATASGAVVTLKAKVGGTASNYPISATSTTDEGGDFANPSFTPTPSGPWLTGGAP